MVGRTQPPESSTGIVVRCSRRRINQDRYPWHPHPSAPKRAPRPARASRASCARPAAFPPSSTATPASRRRSRSTTRELEKLLSHDLRRQHRHRAHARRRDDQDADPRDPAPPVQEADPARRLPGARRRREGHRRASRSCSSACPRACASAARCSSRSCTASRCSSIRRTSRTTSTSTSRNLAMGHSLHVSELTLPAGVEVLDDEDATVCAVVAPRAVVEETPAEGAEARGRAGAHPQDEGRGGGEVIRALLAALARRLRPSGTEPSSHHADDGPMKVILGLGNPGKEYEHTRHNVGWWLIDHLADVWRFDGWKKDGQAKVAQGHLAGVRETVRLVKPQTYMNLSGGVLVQYVRRPFWSAANDLLVLVDEVGDPGRHLAAARRGRRRRPQRAQVDPAVARHAAVRAAAHRRRRPGPSAAADRSRTSCSAPLGKRDDGGRARAASRS